MKTHKNNGHGTAAIQLSIPFDFDGCTEPIDHLRERKKHSVISMPTVAKPNLNDIDLDYPLPLPQGLPLFDLFNPPPAPKFEDPAPSDPKPVATVEKPGKVLYEAHDLPDGFGLPAVEDICKLAAGLLHNQLSILFNERSNASSRREVLEWLLADYYELDGTDATRPMHLIPFTAQFCCAVEEIDYEDLRAKVSESIEMARQEPSISVVEIDHDSPYDFHSESQNHSLEINHGYQNPQRTLRSQFSTDA